MRRYVYTKIQLRIAFLKRTSVNARGVEEFYYSMQGTGLERLEVKMGFKISVRDVREKRERKNRREKWS